MPVRMREDQGSFVSAINAKSDPFMRLPEKEESQQLDGSEKVSEG